MVATASLLAEQGDTVSALAQFREAAKNVSPEARAEADAELAQMEAKLAKFTEHTDARRQWGNAAVDAVLADIDALKKLQAEALELFTVMNR